MPTMNFALKTMMIRSHWLNQYQPLYRYTYMIHTLEIMRPDQRRRTTVTCMERHGTIRMQRKRPPHHYKLKTERKWWVHADRQMHVPQLNCHQQLQLAIRRRATIDRMRRC